MAKVYNSIMAIVMKGEILCLTRIRMYKNLIDKSVYQSLTSSTNLLEWFLQSLSVSKTFWTGIN